ncbi:TIR domain-containing protein [Nitrospira sp. M1]
MKVFLSHCTKDKEFVQQLAKKMQAASIKPWLCEIDELFGDDFVEEIERGLREADLTLLIWSPDAARSAWTGKEWRSVLARETEESRTRLGIILLHDAEIPQLLRTKHRIDAQTDQEKAIKETMEWLVRQRDMRQFEESGAARFIVDYEPPDFVGRKEYFEILHEALVEKKGKYLLWGGPGSGKSTLALKFAWKVQGAFDAVVFQHCGQRTKEEIAVELAERIGLDVKELPPERQITESKKWVCDRRTLLVLDDIWNLDVEDLIPGPPLSVASLSILCTSRQRSLPWVKRPCTKKVTSFAEEETEALFRLWLEEETVSRHRDDLLALANRVEHLPIAVAVAAEMLSRQFGPLDEEATALELERLRNGIHDVPDLLQRAIESQSEANQRLLQAMAVCHSEGFWFPLAVMTSGLNDSESKQVRDQLVNASLVQVVDQGRQRFRLHALLREQLHQSSTHHELHTRYLRALEDLFADWETRWKDCGECLTEIVPALHLLHALDSRDRIAWLAYYGFSTGSRIGELQTALHILQQEEEFWKNRESPEAKETLQRSYGNQALILQAWGQLGEAMAMFQEQESLCKGLGNNDGLQACYGNQALILQDWGQLDKAMTLHQKKEALCKALGNKSSLGTCYWSWGLLARELNDRKTELEKLNAAFKIFTNLNMPVERDAVKKELEDVK